MATLLFSQIDNYFDLAGLITFRAIGQAFFAFSPTCSNLFLSSLVSRPKSRKTPPFSPGIALLRT